MKLLLYCTKAKPYLYKTEKPMIEKMFGDYHTQLNKALLNNDCLNGKIVAECDFEIEKIKYDWYPGDILPKDEHYYTYFHIDSITNAKEFYKNTCLNWEQLNHYLIDYDTQSFEGGYAIHIKNLNIFDKSINIQDYSKNENPYNYIENAPQNMMYAFDVKTFNECEKKILISIRPEWLCKILNGEKTIEVRKKVLKEMLK